MCYWPSISKQSFWFLTLSYGIRTVPPLLSDCFGGIAQVIILLTIISAILYTIVLNVIIPMVLYHLLEITPAVQNLFFLRKRYQISLFRWQKPYSGLASTSVFKSPLRQLFGCSFTANSSYTSVLEIYDTTYFQWLRTDSLLQAYKKHILLSGNQKKNSSTAIFKFQVIIQYSDNIIQVTLYYFSYHLV